VTPSRRISSESPWERRHGYARAVRRGGFIAVSGTVACGRDGEPAASDSYGQTRAILAEIGRALREAGASLSDVVRLRVLYVDPSVESGFSDALKEVFPDGAPALTTARVAGLVSEAYLLEIEADAFVPELSARARDADLPPWDERAD
jgi:enamine deaminase RidA (YjgF/YER057c/UK114 family)